VDMSVAETGSEQLWQDSVYRLVDMSVAETGSELRNPRSSYIQYYCN